MSSSFQIVNGDLNVVNRSFALVSGQDKLFQDLKLVLEEPLGTDPLAPTYGSSLDGDFSNGTETNPFIGQIMNSVILSEISSEIQRVLQKYQADQLAIMQQEGLQFQGRTSLLDEEIVYSIDSVDVSSIGDVVIAQVTLTTLSGQVAALTLPVNTGQ